MDKSRGRAEAEREQRLQVLVGGCGGFGAVEVPRLSGWEDQAVDAEPHRSHPTPKKEEAENCHVGCRRWTQALPCLPAMRQREAVSAPSASHCSFHLPWVPRGPGARVLCGCIAAAAVLCSPWCCLPALVLRHERNA